MLTDPSAEPKALCLSFCTEMVKCSWMGIGIDDLAPVYLARNHVTRVNSFCVLGSMLTSEDVALVTLQHRTALVLGSVLECEEPPTITGLWLALLHLAVIAIFFRTAETRTPCAELYRAVRFVYFHHGPTHGRETTKAMGTMVGLALELVKMA